MTDVLRDSIGALDEKRTDRATADARAPIGQRREALALLLDLFNNNQWCGASLRDIVAIELAVFADRVEVDGPLVLIRPPIVQSLALVVRQLATNAINHGALSTGKGHVRVAWHVYTRCEKKLLHFTWSEVPIAPPPPGATLEPTLVENQSRGDPSLDPQSTRYQNGPICEFEIELYEQGDHPG
jgi:two-component sensor histidine kinase